MRKNDADRDMYSRLNMLRLSTALRALPLEHVVAAVKRMTAQRISAGKDVYSAVTTPTRSTL
jgi:hypothetical protein